MSLFRYPKIIRSVVFGKILTISSGVARQNYLGS